jgi:hypothetical protein
MGVLMQSVLQKCSTEALGTVGNQSVYIDNVLFSLGNGCERLVAIGTIDDCKTSQTNCLNFKEKMARPERFERPTLRFVV